MMVSSSVVPKRETALNVLYSIISLYVRQAGFVSGAAGQKKGNFSAKKAFSHGNGIQNSTDKANV
jgi:hypothetical protein